MLHGSCGSGLQFVWCGVVQGALTLAVLYPSEPHELHKPYTEHCATFVALPLMCSEGDSSLVFFQGLTCKRLSKKKFKAFSAQLL